MAEHRRGRRAERVLSPALDAVDIFFGAYLMARYTAYFTTREVPEIPGEDAMQAASIAFLFAAIFSFFAVARLPIADILSYVFLTASTAGFGTLCGLMGVKFLFAGLYSGCLAVLATSMQVTGIGFAGLLGGIVGAISTGYTIGTMHIVTGILTGIFIGVILNALAILVGLFIGMVVLFVMLDTAGDEGDIDSDKYVFGMPTSLCIGLGAALTIKICDGFVLKIIDELTEVTEGFLFGALIGIIIGLILGANVGFYSCFERNRTTVTKKERKPEPEEEEKKEEEKPKKKKKKRRPKTYFN